MKEYLHQTYYFTDGNCRVCGFRENGELYVRMRQLFTAVMRDGDPADKSARDSLCAGVSRYADVAGGAYGVLCQDGTNVNGTKRLYVSVGLLKAFRKALQPDDPGRSLLSRAIDTADHLIQGPDDPFWEPREIAYVCPASDTRPEQQPPFKFGVGTYPESDDVKNPSGSDTGVPFGVYPDQDPDLDSDDCVACVVSKMALAAAATAACAAGAAFLIRRGRK